MSYNKKLDRYEGYIYQITNKLNGKVYIGQTCRTINERWREHVNSSKYHKRITYIDNDIQKYGEENFDIEWLAMINASTKSNLHEILDDLEREYIIRKNSLIDDNILGYNCTTGGNSTQYKKLPVDVYDMNGDLIMQFESRLEASEKLGICVEVIIKCCRGDVSNYMCKYVFRDKGDSFDKYDTTNQRFYKNIYQFDLDGNLIALYHTYRDIPCKFHDQIGSVIDNPNKTLQGYWWGSTNKFLYEGNSCYKAVDLYDKNKRFICTYPSVAECARALNGVTGGIIGCCLGKYVTYKNMYIRYHGDSLDKYTLEQKKKQPIRKVGKYSMDDELLEIFNSIADAAKSMNKKSRSAISQCCNNKQNQAYGYKWKFI